MSDDPSQQISRNDQSVNPPIFKNVGDCSPNPPGIDAPGGDGDGLNLACHALTRLVHRLIKYSLDNLRPIRTAEAFEAVDWLRLQTWLHCGIA